MLSLPKILLLLAVIVIVVVVSKAFRGRSAKAVAKDKDAALDLKPCPVCGNYVAAVGGDCERGDCPIAKG
jgi:hypothetical protein